MIDVLPDCVLPSSQNTGVGVFLRRSARVASRSGGGASWRAVIRFITPQIRLITAPLCAVVRPSRSEPRAVPVLDRTDPGRLLAGTGSLRRQRPTARADEEYRA